MGSEVPPFAFQASEGRQGSGLSGAPGVAVNSEPETAFQIFPGIRCKNIGLTIIPVPNKG